MRVTDNTLYKAEGCGQNKRRIVCTKQIVLEHVPSPIVPKIVSWRQAIPDRQVAIGRGSCSLLWPS